MTARPAPRASPLYAVVGLALLASSVLLAMRDPVLPKPGLDPSWELAAEYAARHSLVFGRDVIFTYGPFAHLATRLFRPETFGEVLAYDAFATLAIFWVALANRSLPALVALALVFAFPDRQTDGTIAAALFAVFLIGLRGRTLAAVAFAALAAPLALAKYSFALVILPLLLLADARRLLQHRAPVLVAAFLMALLLADLAAGQPLSAIPDLAVNTAAIVLGYGRAMQIEGPMSEVASALSLAAAALAFAVLAARRAAAEPEWAKPHRLAPAAAVLGLAWTLFVAFKMGFVRQDDHPLRYHQAAAAALALFFGFIDRPQAPPSRAHRILFGVVFAGLLGCFLFWRSHDAAQVGGGRTALAADVGASLRAIGPRLESGAAWLTGRRFAEFRDRRALADAKLRHAFPAAVTGSVDAIPWDLADVIGSGLAYRPRPVIQSYSSYTPRLQRLDLEHLAGPAGPQSLILRLQDIDGRLPTLALGPSLPQIGRLYDPVASDPLGLVLRRRAQPRAMSAHLGAETEIGLDRWTPVPGGPGLLVMAHIQVRRSLLGRLAGLLFREPVLTITLRTESGAEQAYRFTPGMAELGVAVSPLPATPDRMEVFFDPRATALGARVTALRLSAGRTAWAFRGASAAFEEISYAPGFAALMPPEADAHPALSAALRTLGVPTAAERAAGAKLPPLTGERLAPEPSLCRGWIDFLSRPLAAAAPGEVSGWGWDVRGSRAFDRIVLADDTGQVVGAAISGEPRPDVPKVFPEVGAASGWKGAALRGDGRQVIAYGMLADGRKCELGRKDWP